MYTQAKVIEIKDKNTAIVSCASEACSGCKASLFCNNKNHTIYEVKYSHKTLNSNVKTGEKPFRALQSGDTVRLYMPPSNTILSTLLVFGLPLLLFPIGYFFAKKVLNANEIVGALCGFVMVGVSFGVASIVSVKNKRRLMPEVVEIVNIELGNKEQDNK